jgi:hypothetical protein
MNEQDLIWMTQRTHEGKFKIIPYDCRMNTKSDEVTLHHKFTRNIIPWINLWKELSRDKRSF